MSNRLSTGEPDAGDNANTDVPGGGYVQSLARGLAVVRAFDAEHPAMTLSEVSRRTGLSRATARRFLLTLVALGYVREHDRHFSLTPQVLRLGFAYLSGQELPEVARPHLQDLSARLGESTSVAVLDGDDIVYVARRAMRRIMHVAIGVGTRFPAYATSMGRVLLAGLPRQECEARLRHARLEPITETTLTDPAAVLEVLDRVREQGYAVVDQELEAGLRSLAVPVRDADGSVIAAVNVSTNAMTSGGRDVLDHLDPLLAAAAAIEADLRLQSA